jgi:hypothetical protein
MTKFDRIARSLLNEEADQRQNIYRQISDLLSAKGIKAFEQDEILKAVQEAMYQAYLEGKKAAKENPFK